MQYQIEIDIVYVISTLDAWMDGCVVGWECVYSGLLRIIIMIPKYLFVYQQWELPKVGPTNYTGHGIHT